MASLVRRVLVLLVVVVLTVVAVVVLFEDKTASPPLVPGTTIDNDPLAYTPGREDEFAAAAARGHAHVIYAKSPGGARASAERVARYRPLLLVLAAGKAASSLSALGFYLADQDVFIYLLNFIVDGYLVALSLLLWSIAGRIGEPAAPP